MLPHTLSSQLVVYVKDQAAEPQHTIGLPWNTDREIVWRQQISIPDLHRL
jgi:hypothetical protein